MNEQELREKFENQFWQPLKLLDNEEYRTAVLRDMETFWLSKLSEALKKRREAVEGMKEYRHLDLADPLIRKLDVLSILSE
jgi:hypothetical protein